MRCISERVELFITVFLAIGAGVWWIMYGCEWLLLKAME